MFNSETERQGDGTGGEALNVELEEKPYEFERQLTAEEFETLNEIFEQDDREEISRGHIPDYAPWLPKRFHEAADWSESHKAHLIVVILVLVDFLGVMVQIFLTLWMDTLDEHEEDLKKDLEHVIEACRILNLFILSIFLLEFAAKFYFFSWKFFTKSAMHFLDCAVVIISFVLELLLHGVAQELVAVFIIVRLWRIIRIIHAVGVSIKIHENDKKQILIKRIRMLEHEIEIMKAQQEKQKSP